MTTARFLFSALATALTLLVMAACGDATRDTAVAKTEGAAALPADFTAFYDRFHADSSFQMSRVTWPLDGNFVENAAGQTRDEQWTADAWRLHRPVELGDSYVREVEPSPEADTVTERIKTREGQYILERRFAKLGGDWYLIWYRVAEFG